MASDDDHILSAAADHRHNTFRVVQNVRPGFALVLQPEPEPGHAMRQGQDVGASSDVADNGLCKAIVFVHMHSPSPEAAAWQQILAPFRFLYVKKGFNPASRTIESPNFWTIPEDAQSS